MANDNYSEALDNYKFPNKSMWNTQASYTKVRRKGGFEELLQLVSSFDSIPDIINEFLEVSLHMVPSRIANTGWSTNGISKVSNANDNGVNRTRQKSISVGPTIQDELRASRLLWGALPTILVTSCILTAIIGMLLYYLDIVTLTGETKNQQLAALGTLCVSVTFIRAIIKKRALEVES